MNGGRFEKFDVTKQDVGAYEVMAQPNPESEISIEALGGLSESEDELKALSQARDELEKRLMLDPREAAFAAAEEGPVGFGNIVGVGIGEKETYGRPTGQLAVKVFVKQLKTGLADSSVTSIMSLLSMLLREAVADRRIGHNPCHNIRVTTTRAPERPHANPAQVNQITARIARFDEQVLVITAAYTGMRWGELTGLARANTHLGDGLIRIPPTWAPCTNWPADWSSGRRRPPTRPATCTCPRSS